MSEREKREINAINDSLGNYERLLRWYARAKALPEPSTDVLAPENDQQEKAPVEDKADEPVAMEVLDLPAERYYRMSEAAKWLMNLNLSQTRPRRRRRVRKGDR